MDPCHGMQCGRHSRCQRSADLTSAACMCEKGFKDIPEFGCVDETLPELQIEGANPLRLKQVRHGPEPSYPLLMDANSSTIEGKRITCGCSSVKSASQEGGCCSSTERTSTAKCARCVNRCSLVATVLYIASIVGLVFMLIPSCCICPCVPVRVRLTSSTRSLSRMRTAKTTPEILRYAHAMSLRSGLTACYMILLLLHM